MNSRTKKLILLGMLGFLILILSGTAGVKYTSQSGFCASCHLMEKNYVSWQKSSHKSVDCITCHSEPGLAGLVEVKVQGVRQVAVTAFDMADKPGKADVSNNTCVSCHNQNKKELLSILAKSKTERYQDKLKTNFDHKVHIKNDIKCSLCHWDVGHSDKRDPKTLMKVCVDCHVKSSLKDVKAVVPKGKDCKACHTDLKKVIPDSHQSKEKWVSGHGAAAKEKNADCQKCHLFNSGTNKTKDNFCFDCHKTNIPHQVDYLKVHVKEYQANAETCNKCHLPGEKPAEQRKANNCADCHKISVPHEKGFAKLHAKPAKSDSSQCLYCHSAKNPINPQAQYAAKNFCYGCHTTKNTHNGGWANSHKGAALKKMPSCSFCHAKPGTTMTLSNYKQNALCASCHVKNPHPGDWAMSHSTTAAKKPATCTSCHSKQNFCSQCHME